MIIAIMITEQCNFHCGHCMINSTHNYSCVSDKVLEKFRHMLEISNADQLYILGGEPFLHMEKLNKVVTMAKPYCKEIMVFTNGTFLLDETKNTWVKNTGVTIRISSDRFHREQWSETLRDRIEHSGYLVVYKEDHEDMIPVGRGYEEFKHLQYNMGCSLLTGRYDKEFYPNANRYMLMLNGDVNLYCATVEAALANVFEDEDITYNLLVEREKILHNYLMAHVIHCKEDTYMAVMCNECPKYKVTASYILYKDKIIAKTADYKYKK